MYKVFYTGGEEPTPGQFVLVEASHPEAAKRAAHAKLKGITVYRIVPHTPAK